ncbi:hypothetical protein P3T73_00840 [Kiritimatiellota bacterium B12222]|nr:hypothetical protein P3T73_00840 [Kiritimatiellota bacterium B12222]
MRLFLSLFFITGLSAGLVFADDASSTPPLLTPSIHVYGVYGNSSTDDPAEYQPGGHDPKQNETFILQSAEPSLSLRWGEYVQGFVTGSAYTDLNDDLEWEWEEYFLKLANLPGGFEARGGLMLSRVGFYNPTHLHSWAAVDAPLQQALYLGEDGLGLEGADISLYLGASKRSVVTFGYGSRLPHSHDHGHSDSDEHDEEEDHDAHEDEDDHDDHAHGEGFEGFEEYRVQDDVFTLGFLNDTAFNDFKSIRSTLFGGMGDNELGESSWFAGAGVEWEWRENGLEPGGRAIRWRNQITFFNGGAAESDHDHDEDHDEHEDEDDHDEHEHDDHAEESGMDVESWGFTTEVVVDAHPHAQPFARFDYISDTDALELSDWFRYTLGVTIPFSHDPGVYLRFQGNANERGSESEQSIWAQFGFSWGGPEVR